MATYTLWYMGQGSTASLNTSHGRFTFLPKEFNSDVDANIPPFSIINKVVATIEVKRDGISLSTSNTDIQWQALNTSDVVVHESTIENGVISTSYKSFSHDFTSCFQSGTAHSGRLDDQYSRIGIRVSGTLTRTYSVRNRKIEFTYTPPAQYYLDLNGYIDGASSGGISPAGTADVYINGSLAANDVADYYTQHAAGSTYEIKDIKANTGWQYDGVHSGSLSGTINSATSVVLAFSKIRCTVSASGTGGSVTGSGTYDYGTQVTLTATPSTGYRFVRWSDGNTNQTRTVTVTSDVTYTAVFEKLKHTVNLSAGEGGSVTGGGTYDYGTSVTIKAVPNTGYHFVRWSDGNISQTRTLTVTANVSLTAYFEVDKINKIFSGSTNTNVYIGSAEAGSVSVGNTKIYG